MKHVFPSLFILLLFSCKKDQYDNASGEKNISLPAYTETGKGSFAFLMDTTIFTIYGAHRETSALFPATWVKNTAITGTTFLHQPINRLLLQEESFPLSGKIRSSNSMKQSCHSRRISLRHLRHISCQDFCNRLFPVLFMCRNNLKMAVIAAFF